MTDIYDRKDYYEKYLTEKKVDLKNELDLAGLETQINLDTKSFTDFMQEHRSESLQKSFKPRPFFDFDSLRQTTFLNDLGYNEHNTFEYNLGIKEEHNTSLKNMLGNGAFDHLQIEKSTAVVRLLEYKPGNGIPLHTDSYHAFREKNKNRNGSIHRYFIAVSEWSWGHFLQVHNHMIHHWKPGYVCEVPEGVFHLSANFGIVPKLSLTMTGFRPS